MTTAPASTASFLSCQKCGQRFGVTSSTGQPVERLTDPFEAACLFCGHRGRYIKASIEILPIVVRPRQ